MASAIVPAGGRDDGLRYTFSMYDDNEMMKQIQATHTPDGREFDVKLLLYLIEDILHHATPRNIPGLRVADATQSQLEALEDSTLEKEIREVVNHLANSITKISSEIYINCSRGSDVHATTVTLFKALSNYSWYAKVVITMAAFAINYRELWLVRHLPSPSNPLAEYRMTFMKPPNMLKHIDSLKSKFAALTNIIKAMLEVTKCIVEFKKLPSQYITPTTPEMVIATTHITTAVYWTIRSVVVCVSQILSLLTMTHEYVLSLYIKSRKIIEILQ